MMSLDELFKSIDLAGLLHIRQALFEALSMVLIIERTLITPLQRLHILLLLRKLLTRVQVFKYILRHVPYNYIILLHYPSIVCLSSSLALI
jgi:hypothetical protein